ncbi:hypothetical protein [Natrarchaeobaculum aegyptiacum]|uniref:Uncharacterized protein n=1 Tax=Natrarchaeobaculum aegyptiacum TaxID=745377 RepID=A0A2Z2HNP9_9EURY|nr:hypothetical protein [Natrarchaeobaculum aegyptiacum]ARS88560.1 hypothetical protein B1756_01495 [Natrarchaeobaculum aegyptiacum]
MGETSLTAWIVAVAFVLLIVVPGSIVVLSLGPLWWLVVGLAVAAVLVYRHSRRTDDGSAESTGPARTNCVNCGARTDIDADACSYCGDTLGE